jgi:ParB-like chromosome segregation protein Spo0J
VDECVDIFSRLEKLPLEDRVATINEIKRALHSASPFKSEPVDCVIWEKHEEITANDYNPNSVAPPEMRLLEHSILEDGYTQPVVTFLDETKREVVDGFHRTRVGKECKTVQARVHGYIPVVTINDTRADRGDRMAATIRHNRARGKHRIEAMSDIVLELKRRNWSDDKIANNLGMDPDEVLRLAQITGLAEIFQDQDFSKAWEVGDVEESEIVTLEE